MPLDIKEKAFGAGDEARTRNFQLGKLDVTPRIFNNLRECSAKLTLLSFQCLQVLPVLQLLVGQRWDNLAQRDMEDIEACRHRPDTGDWLKRYF